MTGIVLIGIIILWLMGFIQIPYLHTTLFSLGTRPISLYTIFLLFIILWVVEILPSPLRQIVFVLFLLWVLSVAGIIAIGGFSQLIVVAIIIGLALSVLRK